MGRQRPSSPKMMWPSPLIISVFFSLIATPVHADGRGLIGWGKTMYNPTCAFACRTVIKANPLLCTPKDHIENFGTVHSPVWTSPQCFTTDSAFLRTMAVCIDTYCSLSDRPSAELIDDYWASHLATTTVGNYKWKPTVSYQEALLAGRQDERDVAESAHSNATEHERGHHGRRKVVSRHGHGSAEMEVEFFTFDVQSELPVAVKKAPMNVTSFVDPVAWQKAYNGMKDFETNEKGHATYTIAVMLVALAVPVLLSLLRFVPGLSVSTAWTYFMAILIYPATWGKRHREPMGTVVGGGMMPNRGQTLYIALISTLNVLFLVTPYVTTHPQSTFASLREQEISVIENRAGVMAMGNAVAMFIFASRNNPLLLVTDWSHSTYLLLHRWLGYWTIFHTILHSVMLLAYYKIQGTYEDELAREYWRWGIVATVSVSIILPTSLLIVRQRLYELFLALHILLSVLFIVGYFLHIWYCYQYNWGYEIFAYVVGGIWATERVLRLARMALKGIHTATITQVPGSNGEYLRVDIEDVRLSGVAYLCFPTLSWRFWETHPFSVVTSMPKTRDEESSVPLPSTLDEKTPRVSTCPIENRPSSHEESPPVTRAGATFIMRTRQGITKKLGARLASSGSAPLRIRVLVEGSYHSGTASQLPRCGSILCIAGGVGITGVLPYLHSVSGSRRGKLAWGVRGRGLVEAFGGELEGLPEGVQVQTVVGGRIDIREVVRKEMTEGGEKSLLGIVVCGPAGMADEVRRTVTELGRQSETMRPFLLVDEAFTW